MEVASRVQKSFFRMVIKARKHDRTFSTVNRYLSGVNSKHSLAGLPDNAPVHAHTLHNSLVKLHSTTAAVDDSLASQFLRATETQPSGFKRVICRTTENDPVRFFISIHDFEFCWRRQLNLSTISSAYIP